LQRILSA